MSGVVLIAESDPFNLRLLEELCDEAGFSVVVASDGATTLNVIARQRPSLVVLDAGLKDADGADVLEVLQSEPKLSTIPVLLTTDRDDEDAKRRGLELGAVDFVDRPYRVFEVEQRIRNLLRLSRAEEALTRERTPLASDPSELGVDPVTHAGGPAQLRITAEYEVTRAVRFEHPLCCIVLRIANFGAIVEASGAETGQGLLVQMASSLRTAIRGIDHLFRSDTDEFVVVLPETGGDNLGAVVDRLTEIARRGEMAGAIEPAPRFELGAASFVSGKLTDGAAVVQAARARLAPIAGT